MKAKLMIVLVAVLLTGCPAPEDLTRFEGFYDWAIQRRTRLEMERDNPATTEVRKEFLMRQIAVEEATFYNNLRNLLDDGVRVTVGDVVIEAQSSLEAVAGPRTEVKISFPAPGVPVTVDAATMNSVPLVQVKGELPTEPVPGTASTRPHIVTAVPVGE